jgi:hypothetical protein
MRSQRTLASGAVGFFMFLAGVAGCGDQHVAADSAVSSFSSRSQPVAPAKDGRQKFQTRKEFCSSPGPSDYTQPFLALPPVHRIPSSGILPFGPKRLNVYFDRPSPAMIEGGDVGYAFYDRNLRSVLRLGWTVSAQLYALSTEGTVLQKVDSGQIHVGTVRNAYPPSLNLRLPSKIGFYRFDIQFADAEGDLLGEFGKYLRIVPVETNARLGINGHQFHVGQAVATRVENLGTSTVTYGAMYQLARKVTGDWRGVIKVNNGPWPLYQGFAYAGRAGSCSGFKVSADFPSGSYRVVKEIGVQGSGQKMSHLRNLVAYFSIRGQ